MTRNIHPFAIYIIQVLIWILPTYLIMLKMLSACKKIRRGKITLIFDDPVTSAEQNFKFQVGTELEFDISIRPFINHVSSFTLRIYQPCWLFLSLRVKKKCLTWSNDKFIGICREPMWMVIKQPNGNGIFPQVS